MKTSSHPEPESLSILGVRVHSVTSDEALLLLDGYASSGAPHHVVTVNPEFCVQAQGLPEFKQALNQADLALADGVGLLWAARVLGSRLAARVTGVDLVDSLAELAARKGYRLFLLGAGPGVAAAAATALTRKHPELAVAGCYSGSPLPEEEDEIVGRIKTTQPHFLFVAFGAPQQDLWIRRNLDRLAVPVAMGVGGAFDYISGRVARAPGWMRRVGLEWLYRLRREPWRWRRMLRLPYFFWLVLAQRGGRMGFNSAEKNRL